MSWKSASRWLPAVLMAGGLVCVGVGCEEPKEKVLDVEAPGFNLEVERSKTGTEVEIDTPAKDDGPTLRIETDGADEAE